MRLSVPNNTVYGQQDNFTRSSDYNALLFLITQVLNKKHTATLVQVKRSTNDGALAPVGFVDVQPLINQLDGAGNAVPHGILSNIPCLRIQGGNNAVILDPKPGDIGLCIFAERDISSVKATKAQANPGSYRTFDMADGIYIGGLLNGTPTSYIQFDSSGNVVVNSPGTVIVNAAQVDLGGSSGLLSFITSAFAALFNAHTHPVTGGTATATPTPITTAHMTTKVKGI